MWSAQVHGFLGRPVVSRSVDNCQHALPAAPRRRLTVCMSEPTATVSIAPRGTACTFDLPRNVFLHAPAQQAGSSRRRRRGLHPVATVAQGGGAAEAAAPAAASTAGAGPPAGARPTAAAAAAAAAPASAGGAARQADGAGGTPAGTLQARAAASVRTATRAAGSKSRAQVSRRMTGPRGQAAQPRGRGPMRRMHRRRACGRTGLRRMRRARTRRPATAAAVSPRPATATDRPTLPVEAGMRGGVRRADTVEAEAAGAGMRAAVQHMEVNRTGVTAAGGVCGGTRGCRLRTRGSS